MSILVYIELENGQVKKASLEALAYGASLASTIGGAVKGIASTPVEEDALTAIGATGVSSVLQMEGVDTTQVAAIASGIHEIAQQENTTIVVLPHSTTTEPISARLAIKLDAGVVTNVIGLPDTTAGFVIKKSVYTSKAFVTIDVTSEKKVLTLKKNSFEYEETSGAATAETKSVNGGTTAKVEVLDTKVAEGDVLLPEAELVISAGRGLKGPENWGMIEDLAKTIGAATACSKPVSDVGWRPHHEHVGQTGIKISPNLYIAVGISGAIQHLAGVSSSKVIVAINTDEDAPFFKAADYGIVGDAFDVVPKLIEALKSS